MKQPRRISRQLVARAQKPTRWDIGNGVLYDLCRRFPRHENAEGVVAKVWLIGRAYSASIERGRGGSEFGPLSNEEFYTEKVRRSYGTRGSTPDSGLSVNSSASTRRASRPCSTFICV